MPGDENIAGAPVLADREAYEIQLEDVLGRLPQGVVVVDRELRIDYVNSSAAQLLSGLNRPRRGEPLPADIDGVPLRTIARGLFESSSRAAARLVRLDGRTISIEGLPANGSETVVLVLEDVTQHARARLAEREFVENAAHELRTPLAAIVSVVEVLDAGAKDDPHARDRFLAHLREHSERVARLSRSLLELARVQTGQQEPRLELVPIAPLLESIATNLRPRPGVEIRVHAADNIAAVTDLELLHHALNNVAANAVKNTFSGEIVLEANVAERMLEVEIRDSGQGMSRNDLDRAFDRFHRARDSEGEGFGLGLAIAKDAIEAVGGTITLESEPGRGARARIKVPGARILS